MSFIDIDKEIENLGFVLTYNNIESVLQYERYNNQFDYTHCVGIVNKIKPGKLPIIQSFVKNTDFMVGLTITEADVFVRKIKSLKWVKIEAIRGTK